MQFPDLIRKKTSYGQQAYLDVSQAAWERFEQATIHKHQIPTIEIHGS